MGTNKLQMPIVDGYSSAKMIRSFEKTHPNACLSPKARCNHRIPIFAVSASLVEKDRKRYMDVGFDGWILKPVDFRRVEELLKGIVDDETRDRCIYEPGKWEQGGWFCKRERHPDAFDVDTHPSMHKPTDESEHDKGEGRVSDPSSENGGSTTGSITPKAEPTSIGAVADTAAPAQ